LHVRGKKQGKEGDSGEIAMPPSSPSPQKKKKEANFKRSCFGMHKASIRYYCFIHHNFITVVFKNNVKQMGSSASTKFWFAYYNL